MRVPKTPAAKGWSEVIATRGGPGRRRFAAVLAAATALVASLALGLPGTAVWAQTSTAGLLPAAPNTDLNQVYDPSQVISEPFVLTSPGVDYLYSSGLGDSLPHVPVRPFTKMGVWRRVVDAMPAPPPWVLPGTAVWAPDVRKVAGHYVMWFSAVENQALYGSPMPHPDCLGYATSKSPLGPFVSNATQPALCQYSDWGDIDPRTLVVGAQEYLLFKSNDNVASSPMPTNLYAVKLRPNGTSIASLPTLLMSNSQAWQGAVVESPDMVDVGGRYFLFFSSTFGPDTPQAGIGVAVCRGPLGPCANTSPGPWLGSNNHGTGPCEESLFEQHGVLWLLYSPHSEYYSGAYPVLAVSRVGIGPHLPYVATFDGAQPDVGG